MYFTSKICEILNRIYFEEHLLTTLLDIKLSWVNRCTIYKVTDDI